MRCKYCDRTSVFEELCQEHFCTDIETRIAHTITEYNLFTKDHRLLVAISGGKDSQVLLVVLTALGYKPEALLINEGIAGYREFTIEATRKLCEKLQLPLTIVPFNEAFGATLDSILTQEDRRPCSVCGAFRRHALNSYAKGYDRIITGHNLDDEAQAVLMNILTSQLQLLSRIGPLSSAKEGFTPRAKPLYFIKEKEVRLYAFLKNLDIPPQECPYAHASFRSKVRDWLNTYEQQHKGTKRCVVDWALTHAIPTIGSAQHCESCGFPASGKLCKACTIKQSIAQ